MQTTFTNASVTRSAQARPVLAAMAVSTSPVLRTPWASTPRAAAAAKIASSAAPPGAGSSRAVSESWPSCPRVGAGPGKPGYRPGAAVGHVRHLPRLALAAVQHSVERPVGLGADRVETPPEGRRLPGVARVLQQPSEPAGLDLVGRLALEPEVQPARVDRPGAVGVD